MAANPHLPAGNAKSAGIHEDWERDNQQWWDWYLSLAENDGDEAPLAEVAEPVLPTASSPEALHDELWSPYPVTDEQVAAFQADGYVKLRDVLSPAALGTLRAELSAMIAAELGPADGPRFASLEMMWRASAVVAEFVVSPRLGRLAADLLGVADVRLYHDNVLSKEPGAGRTPWHFDDHHFPIDSVDVCTVWAPLQAVPQTMGPLAFARGMDSYRLVEAIDFDKFDTSYDRLVSEAFRDAGTTVDDGPFDLGEVSFHHSLCFHTAGANRTTAPRMVFATTYFADGAKVVPSPTMVSGDWRQFIPGARPGGVIDSPMNPVVSRA